MKKRTPWVAGPLALCTALLGVTFGLGGASSASTSASVKVGVVPEETGSIRRTSPSGSKA